MDLDTARTLNELTSRFYRRVSASFSETRQAAWEGWRRAAALCEDALHPDMRVLDLGCGNLRFERFMEQETAGFGVAYAVDNCEGLVGEGARVLEDEGEDEGAPMHIGKEPQANEGESRPSSLTRCAVAFQNLDIARTLLEGGNLSCALEAPACDLSVAFGLMHHLPAFEVRAGALRALVNHTRAGGYVVVSFWQFARNARLHAKAVETTKRGCAALGIALGENDYLLGWKDERDVYRFCHHFEEDEVDQLARSVSPEAVEVARFSADGKTSDLNRYLILRVM